MNHPWPRRGGHAVLAPVARAQGSPNILFFFLDDMRWDAAGFTGNTVITTPHMDTLAAQGTIFENAFTTTAICMVSRASVFMGQHMARHGITAFNQNLSAAKWAGLLSGPPRRRRLLPRLHRQARAGQRLHRPLRHLRFRQGLERPGQLLQPDHRRRVRQRPPPDQVRGRPRHRVPRRCRRPRQEHRPARPSACRSVGRHRTCRTGAATSSSPDPAYDSLYAGDTIPHAKTDTQAQFDGLPSIFQGRRRGHQPLERTASAPSSCIQDNIKKHHRLIHGVDVQIGRILAALDDPNDDGDHADSLTANTIIILSSDHGFFLGERHQAGKWYIQEESIRVPMVVVDPRLPASQKGKRVSQMVLNIDIPATILDYAGAGHARASMQGRSMKPIVEGNPPADWRTAFLHDHPAVGGGVYRQRGRAHRERSATPATRTTAT